MQTSADSARLHQGRKMRKNASKLFPGTVPSRFLVLLVIAISGASRSSAQVASRPAAQTITATSPATPDDPLGLGRETPRGTVKGQEDRSEEHTSELQSHLNLVCRLLLEKQQRSSRSRAG